MTDFDPPAGTAIQLAPGLHRVLAPNPSPMTFRGTNSYLLGQDSLTLIDPGPDNPAHLDALLRAIAGRPLRQIIVTHSHLDHSPLARPLAQETGAEILGFGDWRAGRSAVMEELAQTGGVQGGEGIDTDFAPDRRIGDGDILQTDTGPLRVLHTPGHLGNHICLAWGDALFTGDHVMGWASSLVSPPDGDLTDFMASCTRLAEEQAQVLYPGHGGPVTTPGATIIALIEHRKLREGQILQALSTPQSAAGLTTAIYTETPRALLGAAKRNVLAHLIDLRTRGIVGHKGRLEPDTVFHRI